MIYKLIKSFITILVFLFFSLVVAFLYLYNEIDGELDSLINYNPNISTTILDTNSKRISYIFKNKHRLYASYNEMPGYLIEALIAVEDTHFFEHKGVNFDAIFRAVIKNFKAGRYVEGGSTLTQQLIKTAILTREKSIKRKIKEALLAIKLEQILTKEDILERYLNEVFFGHGYYGIKTASRGFFHKNLKELTLKEIAMLVGLPNAPSSLNPIRYYKKCLKRANHILDRLNKLGWISDFEYKISIDENPKVYSQSLTQNLAPYVTDEVIKKLKKKFPNLRTGGYYIYTTIDLEQQKIAKESLDYGYKKILKRYKEKHSSTDINGAFIAMENSTGEIKALIGGVDYKKSSFNRATMTKRQPGSAFKPFIYQIALDLGYNPYSKLSDIARSFTYKVNGKNKIWKPKNYEGNFIGFLNFEEALIHSRNLATINLVTEIGIYKIYDKLQSLNLSYIPKNMSLSLGNLGVSPMKMAHLYSIFANYGTMIEPRIIKKVVSKHQNIIYEDLSKKSIFFNKPEQAFLTTFILQKVIQRGTGRKARVKDIELAGKTGTTNDNIDAWFCGYSPEMEVIVWFGRDSNKPIGRYATGGSISAPVFSNFYKLLYDRYPYMSREFNIPKNIFYKNDKIFTTQSPLPEYITNKYNKMIIF